MTESGTKVKNVVKYMLLAAVLVGSLSHIADSPAAIAMSNCEPVDNSHWHLQQETY